MSRHIRKTQPRDTRVGLLVRYEDIEPHLLGGETKGRLWMLKRALSYWALEPEELAPSPSDKDIYALHKVMFEHIFSWAGQPRTEEKGPGGIIHVSFYEVRQELKYRFDNLAFRLSGYKAENVNLGFAAEIVAQAHHDFEYVHPFTDTNGRTGRALDHYVLWHTLGLVGTDLYSSPQLLYFPDETYELRYSSALQAADNGDLNLLTEFYKDRISAAVEDAQRKGTQHL